MRRISVARSASALGASPSVSSRATMNASIGLRIHPLAFGSRLTGTAGRAGAISAQCFSHFPPCATHAFNVSICFAESGRANFAGGMRSFASSAVTREMSSPFSGLPGTNSGCSRFCVAGSRSRRNFALRLSASGPWHWKQWSARIGRTSRLKSTLGAPGAARCAGCTTSAASAAGGGAAGPRSRSAGRRGVIASLSLSEPVRRRERPPRTVRIQTAPPAAPQEVMCVRERRGVSPPALSSSTGGLTPRRSPGLNRGPAYLSCESICRHGL